MPKTKLGLSLVCAALACACESSAEEQCTDLIEAVCQRVSTCTEEITATKLPAGFESDCLKQVEQSAGVCAKAVEVSSSYDDCIDDIEALSCDDFLSIDNDNSLSIGLPATCKGVIKVSGPAAESDEPRPQPVGL
jgi:hypothetical protein